jgi:hypothetical protein
MFKKKVIKSSLAPPKQGKFGFDESDEQEQVTRKTQQKK